MVAIKIFLSIFENFSRIIRTEIDWGKFEMQHMELIKKAVIETLAGHFNRVRILKVNIKKDVDVDGDDLLRIDVVFDGVSKDLNAEKLLGTVRRLRPKLNEIHESAIPLLSFVSQADYNARDSR